MWWVILRVPFSILCHWFLRKTNCHHRYSIQVSMRPQESATSHGLWAPQARLEPEAIRLFKGSVPIPVCTAQVKKHSKITQLLSGKQGGYPKRQVDNLLEKKKGPWSRTEMCVCVWWGGVLERFYLWAPLLMSIEVFPTFPDGCRLTS